MPLCTWRWVLQWSDQNLFHENHLCHTEITCKSMVTVPLVNFIMAHKCKCKCQNRKITWILCTSYDLLTAIFFSSSVLMKLMKLLNIGLILRTISSENIFSGHLKHCILSKIQVYPMTVVLFDTRKNIAVWCVCIFHVKAAIMYFK